MFCKNKSNANWLVLRKQPPSLLRPVGERCWRNRRREGHASFTYKPHANLTLQTHWTNITPERRRSYRQPTHSNKDHNADDKKEKKTNKTCARSQNTKQTNKLHCVRFGLVFRNAATLSLSSQGWINIFYRSFIPTESCVKLSQTRDSIRRWCNFVCFLLHFLSKVPLTRCECPSCSASILAYLYLAGGQDTVVTAAGRRFWIVYQLGEPSVPRRLPPCCSYFKCIFVVQVKFIFLCKWDPSHSKYVHFIGGVMIPVGRGGMSKFKKKKFQSFKTKNGY